MPEALEKVRALLGEEAMIVKSRKVSKGGLFGTARRESVEVSAALDNFNDSKGPAEAGADRWEGTAGLPSPALQNQLDSLNVKLDTLLLGLGAGTIDRPATEGSLSAANSEEAIKGLARQLPYCGGITLSDKPTIVALVGATGAGKTTSLLKLAGQYSLLHKKKVSLITADTIRLGAVEQLKAFCRVLGLNLRVVLSPEEMAAAVAEMGGQDLVLVDTPGGSQRDQLHNSQVKAFLQAAQPAETHLVLSAAARPCVIRESIEKCGAFLDADRLLFTKLDEALQLHEVFAAVLGAGMPISYLANGQRIPEDLDIASEARLMELMLAAEPEPAEPATKA